MTEQTDVVQRARQALDGREMAVALRTAYFQTAAGARLNCSDAGAWDRAAEVATDLVTDLLGLVEVTLPTITAQRDDALAEVEKLRAGRVADVELAKASWRDITEAAGLAWRDDDPSMVPGLIESIADLRATVERVREANECLHAHRFDLDPAEDAGHDAWLESLGERRAGGPDVFYNGVEFAHRRICRALDGEAGRG